MRLKSKKGVSLVETMISVFIFMFIIGGLLTAILASNKSWSTYESSIRVQREVRKALLALNRDLRVAQGISVTTNTNDVTLAFTISGVGAVSYAWANNGSNAFRIMKTTPTQTRIIANGITDFTVTNGTNDIEVDVTANVTSTLGETDTFQLASKVAKR